MLALCMFVLTDCIDNTAALSGFANTNIILMIGMFLVAAGFSRTSFTTKICNAIMRHSRGSFNGAYIGFVILTFVLTNFLNRPMVCFAVVAPLMAAVCEDSYISPSKVMFPLMVIMVGCYNMVPFSPSVITSSAQYNGYLA